MTLGNWNAPTTIPTTNTTIPTTNTTTPTTATTSHLTIGAAASISCKLRSDPSRGRDFHYYYYYYLPYNYYYYPYYCYYVPPDNWCSRVHLLQIPVRSKQQEGLPLLLLVPLQLLLLTLLVYCYYCYYCY